MIRLSAAPQTLIFRIAIGYFSVNCFLNPAAKMLAQKLFHGAIKIEAVLFIGKAMHFACFYHVRYFDPSSFQGFYHLIRFRLVYARIVGTLGNQQRDFNVLSMENRRRSLRRKLIP